jgi:putative membrane protein
MSKRIPGLVVFLLLTAATALPQQSQTFDRQSTATKPKGDAKVASGDKSFVLKAAEANVAEVEMGRQAVRMASNDEVKQFAQRMVDDHGKAYTELLQLARSKGISLPAAEKLGTVDTLNDSATTATGQQITGAIGQQKAGAAQLPDRAGAGPVNNHSNKTVKGSSGHKKMTDKLAKFSGAEFDREYIKHQLADHHKAVALFEKQSRSGKDAELKAFAARALPTLKEHQRLAREISSRVGGKTDNSARAGKRDSK